MLFAWSDTPYLAEIEHLRKGICRTFIPAAIVLCKYLPVLAQPIECRTPCCGCVVFVYKWRCYMLSKGPLRALVGLALSICALSATTASADATLDRIKARGTLTVGVILSGAPFGFIDPKTQEQKGFNLDIAKGLADDLGVKLETVTVTPPNRVQFLQQGKVDILIANMQYTEERAKMMPVAASVAPTGVKSNMEKL